MNLTRRIARDALTHPSAGLHFDALYFWLDGIIRVRSPRDCLSTGLVSLGDRRWNVIIQPGHQEIAWRVFAYRSSSAGHTDCWHYWPPWLGWERRLYRQHWLPHYRSLKSVQGEPGRARGFTRD